MARPRDTEHRDAQPKGPGGPRLGRIHDRILEAYAQVQTGTPADRALRQVFTRAKDLGSSERAEVGEVLFGVLRNQRRLDDLLARAAKAEKKSLELLDPPIVSRLRVLAYRAVSGQSLEELQAIDAYAARRIPNVFQRIVSGRLPPARHGEVEALGVELSLPAWLVDRLVAAFGLTETETLGRALSTRAPVTLRVNRLLATREAARQRILEEHGLETQPTTLAPDGLILPERVDLRSWPLFEEGWVELQDEGSQLLALATGALPGMPILDACAGGGGKTLAIGALMQGKGRLLAVDPDSKKIDELKRRIRRAGVKNAETQVADLQALPEALKGAFEVVLVDAPCSGTGTLRRAPDVRWRLEEKDIEQHRHRQLRLIASAATALKPGGRLVYATCSILKEENEEVIDHVLATDPRLRAMPLACTLGPTLAERLGATHTARIGPGPTPDGPDAFFVGLLERVP